MASATKRNIPPHIWDNYPEESRAEMMAFDQVEGQLHRYEEHLAERRRQSDAAMSTAKGKRR